MNIYPLLNAIAHWAVFLETAPSSTLDPDEAVTQQEDLALILSDLDKQTRDELAACFRGHVVSETDANRSRAFQKLPAALGLVDSD